MYIRLYSLKHEPVQLDSRHVDFRGRSRPLPSLYRRARGEGESPFFIREISFVPGSFVVDCDCRRGLLSARTRRGRDTVHRVSSTVEEYDGQVELRSLDDSQFKAAMWKGLL
jgi:hypothetical protein